MTEAELLEEEEADLCNKLVILLEERVLLIEFLGLFCREEDDSEIVDWGELLLVPVPEPEPPLLPPINDLEGVEWTDELMAA